MSLLEQCRKKMKQLKIDGVLKYSSRHDKKLMLVLPHKTIHFGLQGSHTFAEGASVQKRSAYRARHSQIILKNGGRAIDAKYSPAYLSYNLLW
jgi:hypothetical protein